MGLLFEMPKQPPTKFYVSYVPGRGMGWYGKGGTYKLHTNVGHAKNALSYGRHGGGVRGGGIWEWQDGEWQPLWEVEPGSKYADLPWHKK